MKHAKEPAKIEDNVTEEELDQAISDCAALFGISREQFIRESRPFSGRPIPKWLGNTKPYEKKT